jgi:hypothetical protein
MGTCFNAAFVVFAFKRVDYYYAVRPLIDGLVGAGLDAWGFIMPPAMQEA